MNFSHLLSIVSILSFSSSAYAGATIEKIEASVNSSIILQSDTERFRQTYGLRSQLDPLFENSQIAKKGVNAPKADVVEFLVDEALILQQFPVSDADVEKEINTIQTNNKINRETLRRALRDQGYSFSIYFELIRTSTSKRALIDREIRVRVSVSEDDIKNVYVNQYKKKNSELTQKYHVQMMSHSSREELVKALNTVRAGESFESVAKKVSQDGSAENGGDLGEVLLGDLSQGLRAEITKLSAGQTSDIFAGSRGQYFVVKLVEVKAVEDEDYKKAKEQIFQTLISQDYQNQIDLWLQRQRQTAYIYRVK